MSDSASAGREAPPPPQRVLVTGAAGFVGRRMCAALARQGVAVVAMTHRQSLTLSEAMGPGAVEVRRGDLQDADGLAAALIGVDGVVHLAAAKGDEKNSHVVNVEGTERLAVACARSGARRFVYVSTQAHPGGRYGATKYQGEEVVRRSGLDWTIVRPNLIYGLGDAGAFGKVAQGVARWPVFPITGPARGRFWPIHVDDVCQAIAAALQKPQTIGQTYVLVGPDGVTLPDMVRLMGDHLGRRPRLLHLPLWFSLFAARMSMILLPSRPPLSVSMVLGCNQTDVDHDMGPMIETLGVTPRPLAEGMADVVAGLKAGEEKTP